MKEKIFFLGACLIRIRKGDITLEETDAIVNAANTRMEMGGGTAYAIKRRGGDSIEREAMGKAPVGIGGAVITGAGKLPSRHVIHAATMDMDFVTDEKSVRLAIKNALAEAEKAGLSSVSFPALGCGTGRLKVEKVSAAMTEEALVHFSINGSVREIRFVLFSDADFDTFCCGAENYILPMVRKTFRNPIPTVDIIIEKDDGVILVNRKNHPYGWAIPGGFVEYGESLEDAAAREAKEETGLDVKNLRQFHTYSKPGRDPRHHTVSTVFTATGEGSLQPGDDAREARVFTRREFPEKMAFDHRQVLDDFLSGNEP